MRLNIQPIEKLDRKADHSLDVHSIFPTIQGEGPLTGHPAVFIRLAGCNLQCPGCDTVYTGQSVRRMTPEAIVREVDTKTTPPRLVVITGGEPFRQNVGLLTQLLADSDYQVQFETNGTLPVPEGIVFGAIVVVSPKTSRVHPSVSRVANAWKYVLNHESVDPTDGLPRLALENYASPRIARPPEGFPVGAVYLQPMDMSNYYDMHFDTQIHNARNLSACIQSCMQHGYTLQTQLHKTLGME